MTLLGMTGRRYGMIKVADIARIYGMHPRDQGLYLVRMRPTYLYGARIRAVRTSELGRILFSEAASD